jgi:HEAT repeat protein
MKVDEAFEALHAELESPDYLTRLNTIIILGKIGPRAARAVPWLIETLGDSDPVIRRESALALAHFGSAAEPATDALMDTIRRYPSADAAWYAAEALGNIGQAAVVHLPDLRDHLARYRKQYGDSNPGTESFGEAVQKLESVVSESKDQGHAEPSDAADSQ